MSTSTIPSLEQETPRLSHEMSIWDHLDELRSRLLRAVTSVVIAFLVVLIFTEDIIRYLAKPYTDNGGTLLNLEPTGTVVMYFRVALMSAGIIAVPFITYQLLMFIVPGLHPHEKRWIYTALPFTTGFFLLGVAFAWFVMVPAAFEFLLNFQADIFENQWTAQRYFAFLTSILFWVGVSFEMPVILYVVARLGLVGQRTLIENWRFSIVAIAVIAAVITPTVDPFNMILVMAPLVVLYIISIGLVGIAERRFKQQTLIQKENPLDGKN